MKPANIFRAIRRFKQQRAESLKYNIGFYNFWDQRIEQMWLYHFIQSRGLLDPYPKLKVAFFSCLGSRVIIDLVRSDIKIFYTGENVHNGYYKRFSDHALKKNIDLALGFDYLNNSRYLRLPLWLQYYFAPDLKEQGLIERCEELSTARFKERKKFAVLVARHDYLGIRKDIVNNLNNVMPVDCGGGFMKNNLDLTEKFKDNKTDYLRNYNFNICPENSNQSGYVTEKLFQSIEAGCIPIYWGSDNNPEPGILNHEAVLFWEKDGDNYEVVNKIRELIENPSFLKDFMEQPRFMPNAAEDIHKMLKALENRLKELFNSKGS